MNWYLLQSRLQNFSVGRGGSGNRVGGTVFIVITLGIVVILIISSLIRYGIKGKSSGGSSSSKGFPFFAMQRISKKYRLSHDQSKALEFVLKSASVNDPERVIENPEALDKHFKRTFRQMENSASSDEEAQQKMALLFSVRNAIDIQHNISTGSSSSQRVSSGMSAVLSVNQDSFAVKVISVKTDIVLVDCPRNDSGNIVKFPKGTRVNLAFFTKSSKGFSFDSQILGMTETSFGPAVQLTNSREVKSMTQRRFRRTNAALNCDFFLVHLEESKGRKPPRMVVEERRFQGSLTDISIGGCAIKTGYSVPAGSRLKIEFDVSRGAMPVPVLGQVLRINRSGISSSIIHIKFLKVPRKTMNAINTLVFEYSI